MTKTLLSLLTIGVSAMVAAAQTSPNPYPQTQYPQTQTPQTYPYSSTANTNELGVGGLGSGLSFVNRAGQRFSAADLAVQLQNLRSAVDRAMPVLNAFNESYSNSVSGSRQGVGGALSGIVSDVLHRNQAGTPNTTTTASQSPFSTSNILSILSRALNTNSTGAVGAPPSNAQDLVVLENALQPVATILQRLNVPGNQGFPAGNYPNQTYPNQAVPQPYPNGGLTPTGR